jgi:hypothetical protein
MANKRGKPVFILVKDKESEYQSFELSSSDDESIISS